MKPYPKYKDSGVEWIGEVPEGWEVKKLKYCFSFHTGWTPPTTNSDYFIGDNTWITIADMKAKYLDDSVQKLSDEALNELRIKITKKGSLLYSFKLSVGKIAFAGKDLYTNEAILSISPMEKYNLQYYFYTLPECLIKNANENIYGAKILNQYLIKNASLIVPPKPVQKSIAAYLDRKTAQIDNLISTKQKLIELLKEERAAIINQAVTKGLNPDVPMKDSGIEWLGEIPAHWVVKKIKYLLKSKKGALKTGPFGSQLKNSDMSLEGFKVYNQRSVLDKDFDSGDLFISNEKFLELRDFEVFPGDLLLTSRGTIGKCAIFPSNKMRGILHPCLIRIQLDQDLIINDYAELFIQNSRLFAESVAFNSNATTIDVIYGDTLRAVDIVLPPSIKEQNEIVMFVKKQTAKIDQTISKIKKQIDLLQEFRTTLISEVVTGKIDVRDEGLNG